MIPGVAVSAYAILPAFISTRDTGRLQSGSRVHAGAGCPRIPRAVHPVDVAALDPAARSCLILGLGRRSCCIYCWPPDLGRVAAQFGVPLAAAPSVASAARVRTAAAGRARKDPLPPFGGPRPPLPVGSIDTGWIASDDGLDRHAIHAVTGCSHAVRAGAPLREVRVEMPDAVGDRAGWWHPPPAFGWVPGIGRRRLCRECWPRLLAPRAARRAGTADATAGGDHRGDGMAARSHVAYSDRVGDQRFSQETLFKGFRRSPRGSPCR